MEGRITLSNLLKIDPNISIILKKDMSKEIHSLIKQKFGSVKKFSKIIRCHQNTPYLWLNGNYNIKLIFLMKICKLLKIEAEDKIEKLVCMKKPNSGFIPIDAFPIKKDTILASLIGHSLGDGHVGGDRFDYTNRCEELLIEVRDSVKKLPIRNVKIINNRRPNKAPTLVFPKIVRNILVCAGAPTGNKITNSYTLPEWIKEGNKEIKCAFIRALLDDEGNVSNNRVIRFTMSKRIDLVDNLYALFRDIELILESLGISNITIKREREWNGKNGKTTAFTLHIFGYFSFKKFSENIKFNNPKKMESLQRISIKPKKFRLCKGETKKNIIELLKNDSLTIDEIASSIGFTWKNAFDHLSELEEKSLVVRTKPATSRKFLWHIN